MRFVSPNRIAAFYQKNVDFTADNNIEQLIQQIEHSFKKVEKIEVFGFSYFKDELLFPLQQLKKNKNILNFYSQVEQNTRLVKYLVSQGLQIDQLEGSYTGKEDLISEKHQFYLMDYLLPILKRQIYCSINKKHLVHLKLHLEFANFLPIEKRKHLHQSVSLFLNQEIRHLEFSSTYNLQLKISSVFNAEFVDILNLLDAHYYTDKIKFRTTALQLVENLQLSNQQIEVIKNSLLALDFKLEDGNKTQHLNKHPSFNKEKSEQHKHLTPSPLFVVSALVVFINIVYFIWSYKTQKPTDESINKSGKLHQQQGTNQRLDTINF
ncbi:hypothetical protein CW751_02590 [Brumimicrobium salinarum]|uniref:Uncharacterized protein n=1 Tax=Brumimicrobium salinarum TaxID=2058658 RepID=A0A2I0R6R4_9FLAO|nr:hypothetical protein [Brumimicrobium salinarum]PKR82239.1 hypothetical protein CW751_02590 [Brumimicrobium salinarum]